MTEIKWKKLNDYAIESACGNYRIAKSIVCSESRYTVFKKRIVDNCGRTATFWDAPWNSCGSADEAKQIADQDFLKTRNKNDNDSAVQ